MINSCDFLYNFAVCKPIYVSEILKECPDDHLKSIVECIINVELFSKCKCASKLREKLLKKECKSVDEWRQQCIKYADRVRFIVALVVKKILCFENLCLLFESYETFSRD